MYYYSFANKNAIKKMWHGQKLLQGNGFENT
jgi:hypothetical protein